MATENKFDADATKRAIDNANQEIAGIIDEFKRANSEITESFSSSGSALGGNLGSLAQSTFEQDSGGSFQILNDNMDSFMNAVEQVEKADLETESEVQNIYGGNTPA